MQILHFFILDAVLVRAGGFDEEAQSPAARGVQKEGEAAYTQHLHQLDTETPDLFLCAIVSTVLLFVLSSSWVSKASAVVYFFSLSWGFGRRLSRRLFGFVRRCPECSGAENPEVNQEPPGADLLSRLSLYLNAAPHHCCSEVASLGPQGRWQEARESIVYHMKSCCPLRVSLLWTGSDKSAVDVVIGFFTQLQSTELVKTDF